MTEIIVFISLIVIAGVGVKYVIEQMIKEWKGRN
jgi:hypothetical protein